MKNKNNNNRLFVNTKFIWYFSSAFFLFMHPFICYSQDLLSGTELQDSPLSLSLATAIPMTINNTTNHLVISQYGISNNINISQMVDANNSIDINQSGINNEANLTQQGTNNTINLSQINNNNFAEINQEGDANIANVWQEGEQTFVVHQIGNEMVVNISQY